MSVMHHKNERHPPRSDSYGRTCFRVLVITHSFIIDMRCWNKLPMTDFYKMLTMRAIKEPHHGVISREAITLW